MAGRRPHRCVGAVLDVVAEQRVRGRLPGRGDRPTAAWASGARRALPQTRIVLDHLYSDVRVMPLWSVWPVPQFRVGSDFSGCGVKKGLMSRFEQVVLPDENEALLREQARLSAVLAQRSRILPIAAQGHNNTAISGRGAVSPPTVRSWRRRLRDGGLDALVICLAPGAQRCTTRARSTPQPRRRHPRNPAGATADAPGDAQAGPTGRRLSGHQRGDRGQNLGPLGPWSREGRDLHVQHRPRSRPGSATSSGSAWTSPAARWVSALTRGPRSRHCTAVPILLLCPRVPERHTHHDKRNGATAVFAALVITGAGHRPLLRKHPMVEFVAHRRGRGPQHHQDLGFGVPRMEHHR
jgi:hypothetical protein